jgi:hypothetical protein
LANALGKTPLASGSRLVDELLYAREHDGLGTRLVSRTMAQSRSAMRDSAP